MILTSCGAMKKILIVDDEPNIAEIIRLFARRLGYSSDAADSGRSAMEKVGSNQYWAVFCDLQMPGLNGMEIYNRVKGLNSDLSDKFVLLTGSMLDQHTEAAIKKNNIRVLRKPFYFEGIKKIISELET
jgi:CheY-like chemotaxis protein